MHMKPFNTMVVCHLSSWLKIANRIEFEHHIQTYQYTVWLIRLAAIPCSPSNMHIKTMCTWIPVDIPQAEEAWVMAKVNTCIISIIIYIPMVKSVAMHLETVHKHM